jgi:hypothetical protein
MFKQVLDLFWVLPHFAFAETRNDAVEIERRGILAPITQDHHD